MRTGRVARTAEIGRGSRIADSTVIGEGAIIGEDVELQDNVVIFPGTVLGPGVTVFPNSTLGRPPKKTGALARPLPESLGPLCIGAGSVVGASCVLYAGTTIGDDALIGDLVSIREGCKLGKAVLIARCTTVNYEALIGDGTRIMDSSHITGCMVIEDHVFIGPGVITTNDNTMGRKGHASLAQIGGPVVRRGAAIGANATLLPAVEIGELSIVGAGSVVTRNVPPRSIVMGVPARVVREVPEELLALDG